ncbi:MAG: lipopolysaccharide transport periplasmic protein LptA [Halieaceae bacterium]
MSNRSPDRPVNASPGHISTMLLALVFSVLSATTVALPDDREQPIRITADQALRDEKQGFTEYTGNVRMDQGSMHIEADKITIYHVDEDADKIVAEGTPAHMQQRPEVDKGLMHARANIIEYYKAEDRVHLRDNAQVEQDGSTVAGDTIDYFITEQLVRADSNQAETSSRVEVVIPAQVVNEKESDSGTTDSE